MFAALRYILLVPVTLTGVFLPSSGPSISESGSTVISFSGTIRTEMPTSFNNATKKKNTTKLLRAPKVSLSLNLQKIQDTDIDVFVSKSVALTHTGYIPPDLVPIENLHIGEAGRKSELRKEAAEALWKMSDAFYKKFKTPLIVVSGYRSALYQQRLWNLGRCTDTLCAPAGHSEHQLGLAIDIFDATTEKDYFSNQKYVQYIDWLRENAHLYGWHNSYQKGVEIDEYEVEPWHWRYLGVDLATKLKNLGWTFTEYTHFRESLNWLN